MLKSDPHEATILIADDQDSNVALLDATLEGAGYRNRIATQDSREVAPLYLAHHPDLLLIDLMMPWMDGFEVMEQLKPHIPRDAFVPIMVLTANLSPEARRKALAGGARDFVGKPFDIPELLLRIGNLLETRRLHLTLHEQNELLEKKVGERTFELEQAQRETVQILARASEYRDDATGEHARRVGWLSARLGRALGFPDTVTELLRLAAPLHDVGKIGVPDAVLLKPGPLEGDERVIMREHARMGGEILSGSRSALLQMAEQIATTHHEKWDGSGYPFGLLGEAIPLSGRIVALVDVFDALTHERPYKPAWPLSDALAMIHSQRGRHFDPKVVDAFFGVVGEQSELTADDTASSLMRLGDSLLESGVGAASRSVRLPERATL